MDTTQRQPRGPRVATQPLTPQPDESDPPPGYEHTFDRIQRLTDVTPEAKDLARGALAAWRAEVQADCGESLPPPWVFATDGIIEMEWEHVGRRIWLSMTTNKRELEVFASDESDAFEEDGRVDIASVRQKLCWLLSR